MEYNLDESQARKVLELIYKSPDKGPLLNVCNFLMCKIERLERELEALKGRMGEIEHAIDGDEK